MVEPLEVPAVQRALHDHQLAGTPIIVYMHLLPHLRYQEWRHIKVYSVQRALRLGKKRTIIALKQLVQAGYLQRERDPATAGGGYRYLLVESVPPRGSQTTPSQAA